MVHRTRWGSLGPGYISASRIKGVASLTSTQLHLALRFHCTNLMSFVSFARSAARSVRAVRPTHIASCLGVGQRHGSTYNLEVAGLSEEQAEVRCVVITGADA
jgi:hypothetical protein